MDGTVASGRAAQYEAKTFITNRLVVIIPIDNPAKPGLKLDLADKSVPVGQYFLDFLDKAVADTKDDAAGFKGTVLAN